MRIIPFEMSVKKEFKFYFDVCINLSKVGAPILTTVPIFCHGLGATVSLILKNLKNNLLFSRIFRDRIHTCLLYKTMHHELLFRSDANFEQVFHLIRVLVS